MSNQYQAKIVVEAKGSVIQLLDGEDVVFSTTPIPPRFQLVTDLLHSTLEVALLWGLLKHIPPRNPEPTESVP